MTDKQTDFEEVVRRIKDGTFYEDYDWASGPALRALDGQLAYSRKLHEALWLFREFVIRNATQWETGAGHHHPIWVMLAELISEDSGLVAGSYYRFILPDNDKSLEELQKQERAGD